MGGKEVDSLAILIRDQDGVVSRKQVLAAGLSPSALRHRLAIGGPWTGLLPGVYRAETGAPTQTQREMAALLYGGPRSVLTGAAALRHHRLPVPEPASIDILIPAQSRRQSVSFVSVHRTNRMPEVVFGPPHLIFASCARAAGDAVRGLAGLRTDHAFVIAKLRNAYRSGASRPRLNITTLASQLPRDPQLAIWGAAWVSTPGA